MSASPYPTHKRMSLENSDQTIENRFETENRLKKKKKLLESNSEF